MAGSGKCAVKENWVLPLSVVCAILLVIIEARTIESTDPNLHPVILVPGVGGSQLEARQGTWGSTPLKCRKIGWFSAWVNPFRMTCITSRCPLYCTVGDLRLSYDEETHTTSNAPGVEIRVPGFGDTDTVEYLVPKKAGLLVSHAKSTYFHPVVEELVKLGYTRNVNIRGAPYDFRKAPNEMEEYFEALVQLIEETYAANGASRVILMAHSMGNLVTLYLLNHVDQGWKDKYIQSFVAMAGPWGGAIKPIKSMVSGENMEAVIHIGDAELTLVDAIITRPLLRSMPSIAWLMASDTFWNDDEVVVKAPHYNYTVKDYERLFQDIDVMEGHAMRQDTDGLIREMTPPGVEVFCMVGVDVPTAKRFDYSSAKGEHWYDEEPQVTNGDGDGTVNRRSAEGCLRWNGQQEYPVHHKTFPGSDHMGILDDEYPLAYIKQVVQEVNRNTYGDQLLFENL